VGEQVIPGVKTLYKHLLRTAAAVATDNQASSFDALVAGKGASLRAHVRAEFEKNRYLTSEKAINECKNRAVVALSNYFKFTSGLARYEYPDEKN